MCSFESIDSQHLTTGLARAGRPGAVDGGSREPSHHWNIGLDVVARGRRDIRLRYEDRPDFPGTRHGPGRRTERAGSRRHPVGTAGAPQVLVRHREGPSLRRLPPREVGRHGPPGGRRRRSEGKLRVQVDKSVSPDDTLPLTKSILAGARKDFPGRSFVLSVYDPQGEPILRARVDGEGGVRYEVVHEDGGSRATSGGPVGRPGNRRPRPIRRPDPAGLRPIASSPTGPRSTGVATSGMSRPTSSETAGSGSAWRP